MRWLLLGVLLMEGYYGFNNADVAAYLGIPVQQLQMLQEIMPQYAQTLGPGAQAGVSQASQQADWALAQQYAGESGGGPMGGSNRLQNIDLGLNYLAQHPKGSRTSGFDIGGLLANIGTGGLYGLGTGLMGAAGSGKLSDVLGAANNLGIYGSAVNPINKQAALAGNVAGLGAGIGGALGSAGSSTSGFGSATPSALDPAYFGFEPGTLAQAGTSEFGQFAGGIPSAGMIGSPAPALLTPLTVGMGNTGALMGAQGAQQLMGMFGGAPGMPSMPGGQTTAGIRSQGLSPQQIQAMGAEQSGPAPKAIDPPFLARMTQKREQPGLASPQDLSMASLYGLGGQ